MSWGHRRTSDHEVAGVVTPSSRAGLRNVNAAATAPSMAPSAVRWRHLDGEFVARRYGPIEEGGACSSWLCSSRDPVGFSGAPVVVGSVVVLVGSVVVVVGSVVVLVGSVVVTAPSVVDGEPAGIGPGAAVEAGGAVVLRLGVTC